MGKPPAGWEDCRPNCGTQMEGTPFVPFKVPISMKSWMLGDLLKKQPNLDLVIDLCNTDKYYKKEDLMRRGVKHVKIAAEGKTLPNETVVQDFFDVVDSELKKKKDCLIGVHCTKGVHRTGYLICRYVIERMNWEPTVSMKKFAESRGIPMDQSQYINDLTARQTT